MTQRQAQLNQFLVDVFNDILRLEELNLRQSCQDLSVTELHILDAVAQCGAQGAPPGMAQVAAAVGVTSGTLTVAVKTLERKGYLTRARDARDRRRVTLTLSPQAQPVLSAHTAFHETLVSRASAHLDPVQLDSLCAALSGLHRYFRHELDTKELFV